MPTPVILKKYEELLCPESIVKTQTMRAKQYVVKYIFAYEKLIQDNFATWATLKLL